MYVQDTVYDKFLAVLVDKVKALNVGDGLDDATGAGPVVGTTRMSPTRQDLTVTHAGLEGPVRPRVGLY